MSPATRILIGLGLGLGVGVAMAALGFTADHSGVTAAEVVGGMWLDALRMTILPLVFSLVVTGVAATAGLAAAGGVTRLSLLLFVVFLLAAAALAAVLVPALLAILPAPPAAAQAFREALGTAEKAGELPGIGALLRGFIPSNIVSAAAAGTMLPIVFFALVFGFAITRIDASGRIGLAAFFGWIRQAMLVIVGWVLLLAPGGVFALALVVGVRTGVSALGAFAHYVGLIVLMCLIGIAVSYLVAVAIGRVPLALFARAAAPAQAIAFSTQSSLASLPPMLKGSETLLKIPVHVAGVTLPLAVSLFRIAGPLATVTIAIYAAHIMQVPLDPAGLAIGAVVAVIMVNGAGGGLPSTVLYFATMTPILASMGVPVEILALLIAVETIPDMFRTTANVTMDMAVTTVAARFAKVAAPVAMAPEPALPGASRKDN